MSTCCIILATWLAAGAIGIAVIIGGARKTPDEQAADDHAQLEALRAWREERA
jgi:hypothetical protein